MGGRKRGIVLIDPDQAAIAAQLHEYAAALALGMTERGRYAHIAAHAEHCPYCRTDLRLLLDLLEPAYAGGVPQAARRPPWQVAAPLAAASVTSWWQDRPGRLVVQFPQAWQRASNRPLVAATHGEERYRYELVDADAPSLRLTIEIVPHETDPTRLQIEVQVDDSNRSPIDQGGARVTLQAGEHAWVSETDATGCAIFEDVLATALPGLRFEIAPPRAAAR